MRQTVILDRPAFKVTSYGGGTAYAIERKADGASFAVQGDDASKFHDDVFEQDVCDFEDAIMALYGECFQGGRPHEPRYPYGSQPEQPGMHGHLRVVQGGRGVLTDDV